jgi:hypothetical protein
MLRIEDLAKNDPSCDYGPLGWLPALSLDYDRRYAVWPHRLRDAWAVLTCRAVAVQWPHHRREPRV